MRTRDMIRLIQQSGFDVATSKSNADRCWCRVRNRTRKRSSWTLHYGFNIHDATQAIYEALLILGHLKNVAKGRALRSAKPIRRKKCNSPKPRRKYD